tara:strand:+ start:613 stop:3237 length:2625 start_codon:yes stop_codon:yes gene_type:complete
MSSIRPQNYKERLAASGVGSLDAAKSFVQSPNISVDGISDSIIGSAQQLAGATVAIANSVDGKTGPGIGQSVFGNIANGLTSIASNKLSGFLDSAFGGGFGIGKGGSQRMPNPLEQYASFNYVFTLGCLTDFEQAFPDLTYRKKDPSIIILRSGGGPTPGSATLHESAGKTEYFIDDVDIESIITGNPATRSTNATSVNFKVTEPYSMGMFLQALQVSAIRAGHANYIEAPFLLTVEFKGYDDAGNYVHASNLRRMFPLKLVNVEFDVAESGSEYAVQAIPFHEIALTDTVQNTHTDVSFSGSTVAEMLQTGENSLTRILNDREIAAEVAGRSNKGNQYVIMFPTTSSSASESSQFMSGQQEQSDDTATTREFTDDEIKRYYISSTGDVNGTVPIDYRAEVESAAGITLKRSNLGENIREYAEKLENMNAIGQSKIVNANTDGGTRPLQSSTNAENEDTRGEVDCCLVNLTGDVRQATFSAGKKIQTIIEEIIITSEYGRDIASKTGDTNGMIPWFRIETQVFNADSTAEVVAQTGIPARVYVYRVVPYLAHLSKFQAASDTSPGIPQLSQHVAKEYNYMYTGKNKDIINFDIKFNAAFFTSISGDMGQAGADSKNAVTQETVATGENASPSTSDGNTIATPGRTQSAVAMPNRIDGGIGFLSPESRVARDFNEALMNSPTDLIEVDLEILGDPYFITDSGMGNYNALQVPGILNITSDGTMNYQNGEVDVELNFRTPIDYGPSGYMDFPGGGTTPVAEFSGLYQVLFVRNSFSGGQFTQTLQTIRRQRQDSSFVASATAGVLNTGDENGQMVETNANAIVGSADDSNQGVAPTHSSRPDPIDGGIPPGTTTGGPSKLRQRQEAKAAGRQTGPQ